MASTQEHKQRDRVHRKLPPLSVLHRQSMGGTMTAGTPDFYYEGYKSHLWVEWKWTSARRPRVAPRVTELQEAWLRRAYWNHQHVCVIEASPMGFRIYRNLDWDPENAIFVVATPLPTPAECADWIINELRRNSK